MYGDNKGEFDVSCGEIQGLWKGAVSLQIVRSVNLFLQEKTTQL